MSPTFCRRDFRVSKSLAEFVACRRRSDQNDVLRRRAPGRLLLPLRGNSPSVCQRTYLSDCECAHRPPAAIKGTPQGGPPCGERSSPDTGGVFRLRKTEHSDRYCDEVHEVGCNSFVGKARRIFRQSKMSRLFRRDFLFTSAAARQSARYWWPHPCGPDRRSTTGTGRWDR